MKPVCRAFDLSRGCRKLVLVHPIGHAESVGARLRKTPHCGSRPWGAPTFAALVQAHAQGRLLRESAFASASPGDTPFSVEAYRAPDRRFACRVRCRAPSPLYRGCRLSGSVLGHECKQHDFNRGTRAILLINRCEITALRFRRSIELVVSAVGKKFTMRSAPDWRYWHAVWIDRGSDFQRKQWHAASWRSRISPIRNIVWCLAHGIFQRHFVGMVSIRPPSR